MTSAYASPEPPGAKLQPFRDSQFVVMTNRLVACLLSGALLLARDWGSFNAPIYMFMFASLSNVMSSWCQYEALKIVDFPTQVVGELSRSSPSIGGEKRLARSQGVQSGAHHAGGRGAGPAAALLAAPVRGGAADQRGRQRLPAARSRPLDPSRALRHRRTVAVGRRAAARLRGARRLHQQLAGGALSSLRALQPSDDVRRQRVQSALQRPGRRPDRTHHALDLLKFALSFSHKLPEQTFAGSWLLLFALSMSLFHG